MSQEIVFDTRLDSAKNLAWWLYLIHAVSFLFSLGAFSFIPLIVNYVKRGETAGTFVYSHHGWQIRSFWWYVVWMFVGFVLFMTIIGIPLAWLVWIGAWLWKAYRLIKGISDLNRNEAMPG
ncbi:DUF4870 family protein [Rugamonas sp. DEMB1]|jgi:uncharacterized membrane protein|uniref:DUF4870 family protein n=1 Tax=Rugamonas sp. DEMB1 TaxID=3039386 RepID=UPI00244D0836|nr:hypothetical protein [Rugamonas sp. DEMB1]WGG52717.1 hypothetical protein QC826_11545 [Rugamonas sp. DEMB1]